MRSNTSELDELEALEGTDEVELTKSSYSTDAFPVSSKPLYSPFRRIPNNRNGNAFKAPRYPTARLPHQPTHQRLGAGNPRGNLGGNADEPLLKSDLETSNTDSCPDRGDGVAPPKSKKRNKNKKKKKQEIASEVTDKNTTEVKTDFDYVLNENGDPTLLVPDNNPLADKDQFINVESNQTSTHLHHAEELGIQLPKDFDMDHYKKLNREDRINYAKEMVPAETLLEYQNRIGKAMVDDNATFVTGFAGKNQKRTHLKIDTKNNFMSIVSERGTHISTFNLT